MLRWTRSWEHWYRRILPAYWIFLFCSTHFPHLRLGGPVPRPDIVMHLTAFALLAFLFWRFVESFRRPLPAMFIFQAAVVLIVYAAIDEYLQQFIGRSTDLADWMADVSATAVVLSVLEWRRRVAAIRTPRPTQRIESGTPGNLGFPVDSGSAES